MATNDHLKIILHPGRFPGMSGKMASIIGFMLEAKYTQPILKEIVCTSDGFLLGRINGDVGCNDLLGSVSDFKNNWNNLIHIKELALSLDEIKYLEMLPSVTIRNYPGQ